MKPSVYWILTIFVLLGLAPPAQARAALIDALVLVEAPTIQAMDQSVAFIEENGGQALITFAPRAILARLPAEAAGRWVGEAQIAAIHTAPVDVAAITAGFGPEAGLAAGAWNHHLTAPRSPQQDTGGVAPPDDVMIGPEAPPGQVSLTSEPRSYQTSEFMHGSVQVDLFLPESNGSYDSSTETWSTTRRNQVVNEITAGLNWWVSTATQGGRPSANLTFNISVHDRFNEPSIASTRYEPIRRSSNDDYLWITEIINRLGYSGSAYSATRAYAHARRLAFNRDWGFVIFVVDSYNDSDGRFTDDRFGYAYLYGPYTVMTYDNNGWGIDEMDTVTAHETAHIFGARDEYASSGCSTSQTGGYLNIANTNCENGSPTETSIMRSASNQRTAYSYHLASTPVRRMLGWRDSDGDGKYDVIDTQPNVSLTPYSPDPSGSKYPTYYGSAQDTPYPSPYRTDTTINTINLAQYKLDGGAWRTCYATDGSLNSWAEDFRCYPGPLTDGLHNIQVRARNSANNYSYSSYDYITVDTTPPTNPTSVSAGCTATTDVWQNSCSDPNFTWNGAQDATTSVVGYRYYWGTSSSGTSSLYTSGTGYNPSAITPGVYYLRLRTKDQVNNWSSWQTGFILKYDDILPTTQLTNPAPNDALNGNTLVQATVSDSLSGPDRTQFFVWYDDGTGGSWHYIGSDSTGGDGFSALWDNAAVADQENLSFWVYAWDQAGNRAYHDIREVTLDRTPPQTAVSSLPASLQSTTFIVDWAGSDNLTGLDSFDIQYKAGAAGSWITWYTNLSPDITGAWFTGQMGQTYYFRTRGHDEAGNEEPYPTGADAQVYLAYCSGDAYESDNHYSQAKNITTDGAPQLHNFCGNGDEDWLKFYASANRQYVIETSNLPYWTDTYLYLYDTDGQTELAQNDDIVLGVNRASKITWQAPETGYYYLKIRDWNSGTSGNDVTYNISVTEESQNRVYLPQIIKTDPGLLSAGQSPPPAPTPIPAPPSPKQTLIKSPVSTVESPTLSPDDPTTAPAPAP